MNTTTSNIEQPWLRWSTVSPFIIPPAAAAVAIIPAFPDLVAKSMLQQGSVVQPMSIRQVLRGGMSIAPTTGGVVGIQAIFQKIVEDFLKKHVGENTSPWTTMFTSAGIVGIASSPFVAMFNGKTMGWTVRQSWIKFTWHQAVIISIQESAFVAGIAAADELSTRGKRICGDNKAVDYCSAVVAGVVGSLVGHPANTALTRWQKGMAIENAKQLMWGAATKARALGLFCFGYKVAKDILNSVADKVST